MIYSVLLAREAEKILDRLDLPTVRRLRTRLKQLAADPYDPRLSAPLKERDGVRKSRIGSWRILFAIDSRTETIYVLTIDTRGQVYKHSR